ncbi:MAG: hypothetical protein QM817_25860 [Archangium sp.]
MTKDPRYRWIALAIAVWAVAFGVNRWRRSSETGDQPPDWQRPLSELSAPQQQRYATLRAAILEAEKAPWPEQLISGFSRAQQGFYVNYIGEADGLRWLVLLIEPDPRLPPDNSPLDDEHHRLSDGRMLHVSVWTQPLDAEKPQNVVAWPAAEGWTQPR